jgi:hypothetical protein
MMHYGHHVHISYWSRLPFESAGEAGHPNPELPVVVLRHKYLQPAGEEAYYWYFVQAVSSHARPKNTVVPEKAWLPPYSTFEPD